MNEKLLQFNLYQHYVSNFPRSKEHKTKKSFFNFQSQSVNFRYKILDCSFLSCLTCLTFQVIAMICHGDNTKFVEDDPLLYAKLLLANCNKNKSCIKWSRHTWITINYDFFAYLCTMLGPKSSNDTCKGNPRKIPCIETLTKARLLGPS